MLRELTIKNYKSIPDHTIELGRINVFIGENGCGKTNILEAVAMAAAALTKKLSVEDLFNRGMRVGRPAIMCSSFPGAKDESISLRCRFQEADSQPTVELSIFAKQSAEGGGTWSERLPPPAERLVNRIQNEGQLWLFFEELAKIAPDASGALPNAKVLEVLESVVGQDSVDGILGARRARDELRGFLEDFGIYDANSLALRGFSVTSRRTPLGLYGENLDVAISALPAPVAKDLLERARCISWLDKFFTDPADALKFEGHKLGRSQSKLYFRDKHMRRKNNIFSAENANEGILHVLFHLTLFMSEATPKVLGIDNIETALNPQLCRDLMAALPGLAEKHGKQALITTHNPAILDGLNLHDDEQRLFVVSRDDDGHTVTRRIQVKPQPEGAEPKYKLSELWMRGHLGGLPERF